MSSEENSSQKNHPVIKCESVYKIFGENAEKMLQEANGNVDAKVFQEAGCVVGVNNASFEVKVARCWWLWVCLVQENQHFFDAYQD